MPRKQRTPPAPQSDECNLSLDKLLAGFEQLLDSRLPRPTAVFLDRVESVESHIESLQQRCAALERHLTPPCSKSESGPQLRQVLLMTFRLSQQSDKDCMMEVFYLFLKLFYAVTRNQLNLIGSLPTFRTPPLPRSFVRAGNAGPTPEGLALV